MIAVVILISLLAGFGAGYAMRARVSRKRKLRRPLYQSSRSIESQQNPSLARLRRAF